MKLVGSARLGFAKIDQPLLLAGKGKGHTLITVQYFTRLICPPSLFSICFQSVMNSLLFVRPCPFLIFIQRYRCIIEPKTLLLDDIYAY